MGEGIALIKRIAVFIIISISVSVMHAQTDQPLFFAAPVAEVVWYGITPPSMGLGFALGTEDIVSMGLKGIYTMPFSQNDVTVFEITIFLRIYLPITDTVSGLFAQLTYGAAIFSADAPVSLPAEGGAFSIGLTAGWRFLLGSRYFAEPYIRVGYPYYGGAGLCAGVRF